MLQGGFEDFHGCFFGIKEGWSGLEKIILSVWPWRKGLKGVWFDGVK